MRRLWFWIPLFLAFAAAIGFNLTLTPETPAVPARTRPASSSPAPASGAALSREEPSALAANLNAPDGTVERDLLIVDSVLEAFRTNFPGVGNPVGENNEITAALTGRNRFDLQLIPRGHPAINLRGELVDRWGTPFVFHQLSGDVMEIRSAGPDRTMHTDDDAVLAPGG